MLSFLQKTQQILKENPDTMVALDGGEIVMSSFEPWGNEEIVTFIIYQNDKTGTVYITAASYIQAYEDAEVDLTHQQLLMAVNKSEYDYSRLIDVFVRPNNPPFNVRECTEIHRGRAWGFTDTFVSFWTHPVPRKEIYSLLVELQKFYLLPGDIFVEATDTSDLTDTDDMDEITDCWVPAEAYFKIGDEYQEDVIPVTPKNSPDYQLLISLINKLHMATGPEKERLRKEIKELRAKLDLGELNDPEPNQKAARIAGNMSVAELNARSRTSESFETKARDLLCEDAETIRIPYEGKSVRCNFNEESAWPFIIYVTDTSDKLKIVSRQSGQGDNAAVHSQLHSWLEGSYISTFSSLMGGYGRGGERFESFEDPTKLFFSQRPNADKPFGHTIEVVRGRAWNTPEGFYVSSWKRIPADRDVHKLILSLQKFVGSSAPVFIEIEDSDEARTLEDVSLCWEPAEEYFPYVKQRATKASLKISDKQQKLTALLNDLITQYHLATGPAKLRLKKQINELRQKLKMAAWELEPSVKAAEIAGDMSVAELNTRLRTSESFQEACKQLLSDCPTS